MKIIDIDKNFEIVVLEDVFSEKEIKEIWQEIELIYNNRLLQDPQFTGSGVHENGLLKKKNKALFVDFIYSNEYRIMSPILKYTEKRLLSSEIKNLLIQKNQAFKTIDLTNQHSTLISYYENQEFYDYHYDESAYSTLSYFYKEPRSFDGGEIVFKVNGKVLEIPIKNNMSIIFPSFYEHKVNTIFMEEKNLNKMLGRFCISQFLGISLF
jgi:Rps23 Pro-64 3,4-dihydroxylase Tpa1-like proline 4-hydroxylase